MCEWVNEWVSSRVRVCSCLFRVRVWGIVGFRSSSWPISTWIENFSNCQNTFAPRLKSKFSGLLCLCPISVLVSFRAGGGILVPDFLFVQVVWVRSIPQSVCRALESVNPKWRSAAALLWWWWEAWMRTYMSTSRGFQWRGRLLLRRVAKRFPVAREPTKLPALPVSPSQPTCVLRCSSWSCRHFFIGLSIW